MKWLFLVVAAAVMVLAEDLPPTCDRPVYCNSDLLHYVQMARIFSDSKTFVDLQLKQDENTTLQAFEVLLSQTNRNPSEEQIKDFVDTHFDSTGELEDWIPTDFNQNPDVLNHIEDEALRDFAKQINNIWPILAKKVKLIVLEKPELFSLIPVTRGFIIPGGRFKEIYYWDAYWIIEGLLICDMTTTAKGMIENIIELVNKLGFVPNGSRWYYQRRSHPPLLTSMMYIYYEKTKDIQFLRDNIKSLEKELDWWLSSQSVTFEKDGKEYHLLRYHTPSFGPRPESYYEDYQTASIFTDENRKNEFYSDMKSGAESGWDFTTRWFINDEGEMSNNLTDIHTRNIIPVDLNSIFANALENLDFFYYQLEDPRSATRWRLLADLFKRSIKDVFWHDEDGMWFDYDMLNHKHRRFFYPSNLAPLWKNVVDLPEAQRNAPRIMHYLRNSHGLDFPGGIPVSLNRSGEQWDFPNVWPPEVSIFVNGLSNLNTTDSRNLAFEIAQNYVRICRQSYADHNQMFEKYNAEQPGEVGLGGEYNTQIGFGWSNGCVLEFLNKYGGQMTADDSLHSKNINQTEQSFTITITD